MAKGNPNPSPATQFKPGKSGNPGGKTAEHVAAERKAAEMAAKMRVRILSSMQEKLEAGVDPLELLSGDIVRLFKDSEDRAHGTPKQALDHTSSDGSMTPQPSRIIIEAAYDDSDDQAAAKAGEALR